MGNTPATLKEAKEEIKSLFHDVYLHEGIYGPAYLQKHSRLTGVQVDKLVSILCRYPQLASEITIDFNNGVKSIRPLMVLIHGGVTLAQIDRLCKKAPSILQSLILPNDVPLMKQIPTTCSKAKPSVLFYLFQKCPELLSCIQKDYERHNILERIMALQWNTKAVARKEDIEDLHKVICACFNAWPGSCTWKAFRPALIKSPSDQWPLIVGPPAAGGLLDKTIDKMIDNFPLGGEIVLEHCFASDLVVTKRAAAVLGRLLPRVSVLDLSNSRVKYDTTEAFVTMMESIRGAIQNVSSGQEATASTPQQLKKVKILLPSSILRNSSQARSSMVSILFLKKLPALSLCFSSGHLNLNEGGDDNVALEDIGKALTHRKSGGLDKLELICYRATDLGGLSSILASPCGACDLDLSGYVDLSLSANVKCPLLATKISQQVGNCELSIVPSVRALYLHACWVKQDEALTSLLAIVSQLGTLQKLEILGSEERLCPSVTENILQVVKRNKQMTNLSLEYFSEAQFPRLCRILADPGHCLQYMKVVLDARTPRVTGVSESCESEQSGGNDDNARSSSRNGSRADKTPEKETIYGSNCLDDEVFLESALARTLRETNTSLIQCTIFRKRWSKRSKNKLPESRDLRMEIGYYLRLNASGREQARGQCRVALVKALEGVINGSHTEYYSRICGTYFSQVTPEACQDRDRLSLLYGLLREAPGLWAAKKDVRFTDHQNDTT